MPDFPSTEASPLHIHSLSQYVTGVQYRQVGAVFGPVAFTWVANQAAYVPFSIPWPYPVRRVFWINGSTLTTSNADFGIYTERGARIYNTGSTAMSGASVAQYVTPSTPFVLPPGRYFMAWACDNTTNRAFGQSGIAASWGRMVGLLEQATAFPLPSPATFTTWANDVGIPVMGITKTSSGF